ncbi:uncharacterized protein NEMAJ01_0018 [Nematocida major]|uniref:uncharacterized protein n=1 Tax=Nematocida major TaxID=1912982 RepID=UPI002008590C|nr:uncharacterized protein NEMAJ01_0018 [Nematocida major]KAH9385122.1 hypothetical protein NEMAJ01_0018 [Nematocida major]
MLQDIANWFRRRSGPQDDLKMFFEETTEMCFKSCVSSGLLGNRQKLTEKERACVRKCTEEKIKIFLQIEESLENSVKQANE